MGTGAYGPGATESKRIKVGPRAFQRKGGISIYVKGRRFLAELLITPAKTEHKERERTAPEIRKHRRGDRGGEQTEWVPSGMHF